jgi:magnesium transporter
MSDFEAIQNSQVKVKEMIERHKLVEDLVRRQEMMRHDLVQEMVHKNNLTELQHTLESQDVQTVAGVLDALPIEDCKVIWAQIKEERKEEILLLVSDSVRVELISEPKQANQSMVIRVFDLHEGRLRQIPIYSREDLAQAKPIWVDLVTPEEEQLAWAKEIFGVNLPNPNDINDLETSARFYEEENGEVHLHSAFLLERENESRSVAVAFIMSKGTLFSVRGEELPVFRLQRLRARAQAGYVSEAKDVLLDLYAADVEYSANALEDEYVRLEMIGRQVFKSHMTNEQAAKILTAISTEEDLNGRIRRNVLDTRNALSFLMRRKFLSSAQHEDVREILRDIESLDGHTNFLFNKINFQMDATVGFLNVNQNKEVKRLTVISVVFMPINVLAGIGGMSEFSMMTKNIPWQVSYSIFIIGMIGIGVMTYLGLRYLEGRRIKSQLEDMAHSQN